MEAIQKITGITIPIEIFFNAKLTYLEKMIFGLILEISNEEIPFTKNNRWISNLFHVTPQTISTAINNLQRENLVIIQFKNDGTQTRCIWRR